MNEDANDMQRARATMSAQKVRRLSYLGAFVGAVVLPLGVWFLGSAITPDEMAVWFWLTLLAIPVGIFVGGRIALALMARWTGSRGPRT